MSLAAFRVSAVLDAHFFTAMLFLDGLQHYCVLLQAGSDKIKLDGPFSDDLE